MMSSNKALAIRPDIGYEALDKHFLLECVTVYGIASSFEPLFIGIPFLLLSIGLRSEGLLGR